MGCECANEANDTDLYTAKVLPNDLKLNTLSLPEDEKIQSPSFPYELSRLIKTKLNKISQTPIKFIPITVEEFNSIQNRNTFAPEIIKLFTSQLDQIEYENDVKYRDIPPIKVLDPNGGSQYYQGGFNQKGQCHGKGIWVKDYDIYIGNFRNDEFYGKGLYISEHGEYYFGQWKNSMCDGVGNLNIDKKFRYEGNFKNGKKEGYGEEIYPEGDMYKGGFYNGEKNGRGQYIFKDGTRYDGNFKNNKYNGFGQISLSNGDFIRGQFKDGKLNGEGDVNWNDGTKFVGNFVEDKKYGRGTYVGKDGQLYKGVWEDNVLSGNDTSGEPIQETNENIMIE